MSTPATSATTLPQQPQTTSTTASTSTTTQSTRNAISQQPHTTYTPQLNTNEPIPSTLSRKTKNEQAILISERQRGNPLIPYIKSITYEYINNITPDYIVGETTCVLYISIKYHITHPKYIQSRFDLIGKGVYNTRILLVQIDLDQCTTALHELTRISLLNEFTILCSFTLHESARYLETFKVYEKKNAESIQEKINYNDHKAVLTDVLTLIKGINKTDVNTICNQFNTFNGICHARLEQLALCPGFGEKKVKRLYHTLHAPFISNDTTGQPYNIYRTGSGSVNPSPSPVQSPTTPATVQPRVSPLIQSTVPPTTVPITTSSSNTDTTSNNSTTTSATKPPKAKRKPAEPKTSATKPNKKTVKSTTQTPLSTTEQPILQPVTKQTTKPNSKTTSVDLSDDILFIE